MTRAAKPPVEPPRSFDVLDALGLARLVKRSPTLDGQVPLRAAQACSPLLEGNAFGLQVTLTRPITIARRLGGLELELDPPHRDALAAAHRAALARLVAQGFLDRDGPWHRLLARGFAWPAGSLLGPSRLALWTGLLARADPGVWLRLSGAANRRNLHLDVAEAYVPDDGLFVPIVLEIELARGAPDRVRVEGEVGTVAPVAPSFAVEEQDLASVREVGEAHARFYDAAYFAAKKGEPTRKYRRMIARRTDAEIAFAPTTPTCRVVSCGPRARSIAASARCLGRAGFEARPGPAWVVHENLVGFEARYDGHTLAIEPDRRALDEGARAVERAWSEVFGPAWIEAHRGAIWYLTKYFTPHPPGEPHFFVKPWAFTVTPPGWSSLVEGVNGDGYDVLRGVISTDVFFATPAVFHVRRAGAPIRVPAGAPLLRVLPVPRRLLASAHREATWRDA